MIDGMRAYNDIWAHVYMYINTCVDVYMRQFMFTAVSAHMVRLTL